LPLRWLSLPAAALLRTAHRPAAVAATLAAVGAPHAWLADGEFRFLAFRNLAFLPWQGGANQSPVNGAVVFWHPWFAFAAQVFGRFIRLELLGIECLRETRLVPGHVIAGDVVSGLVTD
jgi:hypothetical protein